MKENIAKSIALPPDLIDKIEKVRISERRSFNAQVTVLLEKSLETVKVKKK